MKKFTQMRFKSGFLFLLIFALVFDSDDTMAQRKKKKTFKNQPAAAAIVSSAASISAATKNRIYPYAEVITPKAKSKEGLFHIHKIEGKYFYEIPYILFGREMLIVTTIAKTADGGHI